MDKQFSRDKFYAEKSLLVKQNEELVRKNEELYMKLGETEELLQQDKKTSTWQGATSTTCNPNAYHCCICHRDFFNEKLLQTHVNRHLHEDKAFCRCPLCHEKFSQPVSWAQLIHHMQEHQDQIRKKQ